MPDQKRGSSPPGPASRPVASAARPPPKVRASSSPKPALPNLDESDLPLPSDNRSPGIKALAPLHGAFTEKLREWQQAQLPEEQLFQFHQMAFGALAFFIILQAVAPTAAPSLWWAFISQPLILGFPSNALGGFWYVMGVALWLAYGAYHVTQGAILSRTQSRWPWSPLRTLGLALIPLYNVYGSWVLFSEAFQRLESESDKPGRGRQAKSALMGAMAMIGATWGLQLASDLGLEIPEIAVQASGWARSAAELATLGLGFFMMRAVIRKVGEEGPVDLEEGEDPYPLSRGTAGPGPRLTLTVMVGLLVFGIAVYVSKRESLECGKGGSLTTTSVGSGERALYCQRDGFPEGPWRVRTKNGLEQFNYTGGKILGPYTLFYPDGTPKVTGSLNEKKKVGTWTTFGPDGMKTEQVSYANDKLEGPSVKFFPDGKVAQQKNYRMDKLEGKYLAYHPGGAKAEEGDYVAGQKVGRWMSWNPQGLVVEDKDWGKPGAPGTNATGVASQQNPEQGGPTTQTGGTPGTTAGPAPQTPALAVREVTEHRFFAGRPLEWWEDRLTRIKQRVGTGDLDAKVYELTKKRAQANGLEVMDAQQQVKVRVAATASPPQGGQP
ncbi:MAG TPA: hypothetical protein VFA20_21650 [Myxococcaceae bacterium]|nr:hypothetical protein [Myxococcaceae bacterium]